jgi:hypothetical protein
MTTRTKASKVTARSTASAASSAAPPATPVTFIAAPPAGATIPSVPGGFVATTGANYRGVQPQKAELVALPLAIKDLYRFTGYATVFGATAPPLVELLEMFDVTNRWSIMRNATMAWDEFSREQAGISWTAMRTVMPRLKAAFELAAKTNPSIVTTFAGLAAFLGAKAVSAKKAVATKKKDKQDAADGKPPTHGQVGKKRQRRAAKAALEAQSAKAVSGSPPIVAPPTPAPAATSVGPAPVDAPAANVAPAATSGTPRS